MLKRKLGESGRRGDLARDLSYIIEKGARTRRHRLGREARFFAPTVAIAIIVLTSVYLLVSTRLGRDDWANLSTASLALSLVPIFSAGLLLIFRRHEAPITSSIIVSSAIFSFCVSALSAVRLPVSYQALFWCYPLLVVSMAYANVRFQQAIYQNVAILPFDLTKSLLVENGPARLISDPDEDLQGVEVVVIDPVEHHKGGWTKFIARCYIAGVEVMTWPRYIEIKSRRLDVSNFEVFSVCYSPSQIFYYRAKRFIDIFCVILLVPAVLPLCALTAIYIHILDGGPVLFVQVRKGFGGRSFRMFKFRTMYSGREGGATVSNDSRILPGCKLLRSLRFDELPQLINIMLGDMTFIGPRPEAVDLARKYDREIPKYPLRLLVLPGLTGWAQVNYGYTSSTEEARTKLSFDLYYIKHLSFDLDLLIAFRTVKTVLFKQGGR